MKAADIQFSDDGTPTSTTFGDVYFSKGQGCDETQYVFIEQNQLPERFKTLAKGQRFTIAETGFGTGLNFLLAWQNFIQHAPTEAKLTFISVEKYPLALNDLARSHAHWPTLAPLAESLQQSYPPALEGYHQLEFDRVTLLLMFGDAAKMYQELSARVDAWFLDGFAPSKNPDMWQPELFTQIARLSHSQTTVATFTAARLVRDGLLGAGFHIQKVKGFGRKREMVKGLYTGIVGPLPSLAWPCAELPLPSANAAKKIAIIGAGLAGVTTAIELKARGYDVELFEQADHPAAGGSGNRQGAVYAKLSAQPTMATAFYAQALLLAQQTLRQLPEQVDHDACGLVQLVHDERELKRLLELDASDYIPNSLAQMKSAQELSELLGVKVEDPGLWFAQGGWLAPAQLIDYWLEHHQLHCHFNTQINQLTQLANGWQLTVDTGERWQVDQVVICNAFEARHFSQTQHLPLNTIAGQVTQLQATQDHEALKAVVCTDRYVMPTLNGQLTIGSTFRLKSTSTEVTEEDHQENIAQLARRVPNLLTTHERVVNGRAAVRCNAPDYLPLVGGLSEPSAFKQQFRLPLQRNLAHKEPAASTLPGLWLNVAHGSKGLCSSHLSAKLLAAMIHDEPLPVPISVVQALNPNRFLVRELLREKRKKLS